MTRAFALAGLLAIGATLPLPLSAQSPARGLTLITPDGRQSLETVEVRGRELIPLDALAARFRLDVGEDTGAGTLTISAGAQAVILTANQQLASVNGRLVSLGAPPLRTNGRWLVPFDFIGRALAPVYGERIELRERSRLLLVGDVRVPRVSGRYRPRGRSGRLSLEITPATPHEVREEPGRILITFDADAVDVVRHPQTRGDAARDIRVIEDLPGLSIELGPSYASHSVSSLPAPDGSAQLVIDLSAVAATTSETRPASPPAVRPAPAPAAPSGDPLPAFERAPAIRTVVIDAGHGGSDEGAEGPEGTLEKAITLSVAQRLAAALERTLGVRVIQTRSQDTVVDLDRRAAIANNNEADLFISLHANSSVSPVPAGAEVFYLSLEEYGAEAREIADREGPHLPVVGGGTREIDMILWEMAQARYLEQSARLAEVVESELRRRVPMSARAIQQAPFRVLVGANMPAVLVEMGFISNPEQERQLADDAFQTSVVDALVASITRFRDYLEQTRRTVNAGGARPRGDASAAVAVTDDARTRD